MPDLSRYDDKQLEAMLWSYRQLARDHISAGHFALGKWATKMVTHLALELNARELRHQVVEDAQLALENGA